MKKILNVFALLFVVLCSGAFVGCGTDNKTNSISEDFKFTYVKGSAEKTTESENYNIKINLTIENQKEADNNLDASKFVLKQQDKKVNTSASFLVSEEKKTTIAFKNKESKETMLCLVTAKTLSGECILYYGDVQLFKVEI